MMELSSTTDVDEINTCARCFVTALHHFLGPEDGIVVVLPKYPDAPELASGKFVVFRDASGDFITVEDVTNDPQYANSNNHEKVIVRSLETDEPEDLPVIPTKRTLH